MNMTKSITTILPRVVNNWK